MRQRFIYIFSILLLWMGTGDPALWAQEYPAADSVDIEETDHRQVITEAAVPVEEEAKGDTASTAPGSRNRFEISFDYLKLVSLVSEEEFKLEGGLGYISKLNIGINVEVGYGEKTPDDFYKNAEYKVYGYYGRAGLSYYYPYNPGVNFIIGARYAMSLFQDEATFSILSSLWDDYNGAFQRENLEASWAELILGTESSVKGILYFGFTFRIRFLIQTDNFPTFEVYSIPGYGRTFDTIVPALNLYVKLQIPFGKGRQAR